MVSPGLIYKLMTLRSLLSTRKPLTRTRLRRLYYQGILRAIPTGLYHRVLLYRSCSYWPNLKEPRTFNEYILRYMHTARDHAMPFVADKYLVRDYVRSRVGEQYVAEILRKWPRIESASCHGLPESYVVKASHGSGFNLAVRSGELTDAQLREQLLRWSKIDFYWHRREWVYKDALPRYYAEEFLGSASTSPDDYKTFVFNGTVEFFQVDTGRFGEHRRTFFDRSWAPMEVEKDFPRPAVLPGRPVVLDEMIEIAEKLGEEFPFVRVDMYVLPTRIVVGELTFYPKAGTNRFASREQDLEMGKYWKSVSI